MTGGGPGGEDGGEDGRSPGGGPAAGGVAPAPASGPQPSPVAVTDLSRTTGRSSHSSPAPAPLGCTKIDFLPSKSMVALPVAQAGHSKPPLILIPDSGPEGTVSGW